MAHPQGYLRIAGEWSYAPLRVGLVIRAPDGAEVYFQPGDEEDTARETIAAIEEFDIKEVGSLAEHCANVALGDYFQ